MNNIPVISLATLESQSQQFYRLNPDDAGKNIDEKILSLKETNPLFTEFITKLFCGILSAENISQMNKLSKTPEEFNERIFIGTVSAVFLIIKMIDSQIEANNMKELSDDATI